MAVTYILYLAIFLLNFFIDHKTQIGWERGPTQQRASAWPCAAGALLCQGILVTFCPTKSNKEKNCYQDRKGEKWA